MATERQIRVARALLTWDGSGDIFACTPSNEFERLELETRQAVWLDKAKTAIKAAAPTEEEKDHGIKAVVNAINEQLGNHGYNSEYIARVVILVYLASTGGTP